MCLVGVIGSGLALAQGEAGGELDATVGGRVATLTAEEQAEKARSIVDKGEKLSKRVSNMLNEARKEADIIRITCLNDKLTQINANLRNAKKRLEALLGAVDPKAASHEYTVLTVIQQKFQTLEQEANQCVGQDIYEIGATEVTTEIDPSMVPDDQGAVPEGAPSFPVIPPPATGYY
jgi:TPP-dependent 2-oxoacid decarboxylase